jgi:hypothetical protein
MLTVITAAAMSYLVLSAICRIIRVTVEGSN